MICLARRTTSTRLTRAAPLSWWVLGPATYRTYLAVKNLLKSSNRAFDSADMRREQLEQAMTAMTRRRVSLMHLGGSRCYRSLNAVLGFICEYAVRSRAFGRIRQYRRGCTRYGEPVLIAIKFVSGQPPRVELL